MLLDWLISFGMAFSGQAVITYAAVKMLRTTRPAVIWAIAVVGCMVTGYSNAFAPSADFQAAWSAFNLVLSIVTYIVFSGLRPIKAVLVVACIMLVTLLAEFATVFVMLYGFGVNIASGLSIRQFDYLDYWQWLPAELRRVAGGSRHGCRRLRSNPRSYSASPAC